MQNSSFQINGDGMVIVNMKKENLSYFHAVILSENQPLNFSEFTFWNQFFICFLPPHFKEYSNVIKNINLLLLSFLSFL